MGVGDDLRPPMKPRMDRRVWLMIALLAAMVLGGVGGLLYAGLRTSRIEVARLPRNAWGFGHQRIYWLFVGDRAPRDESTVWRLGVFSVTVTVRTRFSAGFDPQRHGVVRTE
jgi:hypothetical protein